LMEAIINQHCSAVARAVLRRGVESHKNERNVEMTLDTAGRTARATLPHECVRHDLLVAQSYHRVDADGAAGGDVDGQRGGA
jgi:hypothetical protein